MKWPEVKCPRPRGCLLVLVVFLDCVKGNHTQDTLLPEAGSAPSHPYGVPRVACSRSSWGESLKVEVALHGQEKEGGSVCDCVCAGGWGERLALVLFQSNSLKNRWRSLVLVSFEYESGWHFAGKVLNLTEQTRVDYRLCVFVYTCMHTWIHTHIHSVTLASAVCVVLDTLKNGYLPLIVFFFPLSLGFPGLN